MKYYLLITVIIFTLQLHSQNLSRIPISKEEDQKIKSISLTTKLNGNLQVSRSTFDELVFQDLNYLILGDDSPQQGISYEYKEDLSSLKLSGYLTEYKWNKSEKGLITLDGEFWRRFGSCFIFRKFSSHFKKCR